MPFLSLSNDLVAESQHEQYFAYPFFAGRSMPVCVDSHKLNAFNKLLQNMVVH